MWSSSGREREAGRGYAHSTARKRLPSASMRRAFFHCFGCHEKGDVITFLTKIEQRPFMDVLHDLAGAAGIDLDVRPLSPAERQARQRRGVRARADVPRDGAGGRLLRRAVRVAGRRGRARLRREARHRRRRCASVSASATRRRAGTRCRRTCDARRFRRRDLERLGLVGVNERGRYDFFRDRVMLPVIDRQKRVIGFGGRLLDPEAKDRKYVNSPESPLFHKKERSTACTRRWTPSAAATRPWSSRGTSTCWRCTRRASKRPSRRWEPR